MQLLGDESLRNLCIILVHEEVHPEMACVCIVE